MDWQNAIALAIVAAAAVYLCWNAFGKSSAKSSSCGSCGGCEAKNEPDVVTLKA